MTAAPAEPRTRRVGTFTLGLTLVAAGGVMLASLLRPRMDLAWTLKAAPLILIVLGVEVLLAARGGGRVRYDWLGMLLTFLLAGAGLVLCGAAWAYENQTYCNISGCTRSANDQGYRMEYQSFDGFDSHILYLEAGDLLKLQIDAQEGWLEVEVSNEEDGETLLESVGFCGERSVRVTKTGGYIILVHGHRAGGSFAFERLPDSGPAADLDTAGTENLPEETP